MSLKRLFEFIGTQASLSLKSLFGNQELGTEKEASIQSRGELSMQEKLVRVAVSAQTRQAIRQCARSESDGFVTVAPDDRENVDTKQSVVESDKVWFVKHTNDTESNRIVRLANHDELRTESKLFRRSNAVKKLHSGAKICSYLGIVTPQRATELGYTAVMPVADLILCNTQRELSGACTSEASII